MNSLSIRLLSKAFPALARKTLSVAPLLLLLLSWSSSVSAATTSTPGSVAEQIRVALFQAQVSLSSDTATAQRSLSEARNAYSGSFAEKLADTAPALDQRIRTNFDSARTALTAKDARSFTKARATIWTSLLAGGYTVVEASLKKNDGASASSWLAVREFRTSTRFSRPNTDATVAVDGVIAGTTSPADALLSVRADLLDTYQAQLNKMLTEVTTADKQGFTVLRVEKAALASGYFAILAPAYGEQRGAGALQKMEQSLAQIETAALEGKNVSTALTAVNDGLHNFRAAPLSSAERTRRTGQLLRFLSLVPVEYGRGVNNGVVTRDFEIREAVTFRNGAAAAFADLENLLAQRNATKTTEASRLLAKLQQQLADTESRKTVAPLSDIQRTTDQLTQLLKEIIPSEWQQRSISGDFDVIASVLDQMETGVANGDYNMAESARLEAYAVLETGPEARLVAFAPQSIKPIEDLFWYGQGEHKGLGYLLSNKAPLAEVKATRQALDRELAAAQKTISSGSTPFAVATNAAIIVFREGLEAVLILASLMGSLKRDTMRHFRRPLWVGSGAALIFTALTWILAGGILSALARFGERLEAIVSLIAIAVLLLITNWFFHKVYWTGWIANFHARKGRLLRAEVGQWIGLAVLGFTSIYREGFETVLFLQALVLEAGVPTVLGGIGLGLGGTLIIGLIVFALQVKLPYKKMLIATGVMIGAVLLIMVGNTAQVLQVVGWLPIHPLGFIQFPYWSGLWFGLYATWEGILLQLAAGAFVIGSYFLAERQQHKRNDKGENKTAPEVKAPAKPEAVTSR